MFKALFCGCDISKPASVSLANTMGLRHFGHILNSRPLHVGCSTLTQSDVTSEPITPDPTTQLTKVSSTL